MTYKKHEKKDGKLIVDFEINGDEWEQALNDAYSAEKGKYKVQGFRPGKASRAMVEKAYNDTSLFYESAFSLIFRKQYADFISKETDVEPVDYPEVDVKLIGKDGVKYTATITLVPEVKLGKYTGLEVKKTSAKVTDAEVKKELELLQERNARFVSISTRAAKDGDLTNIDFAGSVDGVKFEGGTAKNYELTLGSKSFIEGFEEQVVGMKVGETKNINVTFPENYHSVNLKGKPAVFEVKLLDVREKQTPALDDAFAKDVSEFETMAELKADYKKKLQKRKEENADRESENKLVEMIVKNAKVDVPNSMVERQIDFYLEEFSQRLGMQGLNLEHYLKYLGQTEEQFRDIHRKEAEKAVTTHLVIDELIKAAKIDVSEEEILEYAKKQKPESSSKSAKVSKKSEEIVITEAERNAFKNHILSDKVIKFLKENNKIVEAN